MKKGILLAFCLILVCSCTNNDTSEDNGNGTITNNGNTSVANQMPTGTSSHDLLSDETFTSMIIELVYVEGYEPTQNTINNLISFLEARTFKPDGLFVETRAIASPGSSPYTNEEIIEIEDTNITLFNTNNQIAIWAFFADGESANNSNSNIVLGTAYRNTSFVIYEETIHDLSNSAFEPNRDLLETTVILHEFGHILGLTNLGTTLQSNHEDPEHHKHCDVESCLMYWSAETASGIDNLIGTSSAPELDDQCIADLQANGGK